MNARGWYESFRAWIHEPCPLDAWLFRGQAARYTSVQPSLLREPNRRFHGIELYELGSRVVEGVLARSPLLAPARIHPAVINSADELEITSFASRVFGTPPAILPRVSLGEVVRALAQHYGFPTLFVDLTLDPRVAAFFATYEHTPDGYVVRESEPSIVYRWPATRSNSVRMEIPVQDTRSADGSAVSAIDLTQTSRYVRRPHNQYAVLATPVSLPDGPPPVRPFVTPLEEYTLIDLAELGSCETFKLPAGAGFELTQRTRVAEDALFPDRIDLGHSCLSLMAFLSMVVHHPADGAAVGKDDSRSLMDRFEYAMDYAAAILEHESLRLVPGYRPTGADRASVAASAAFLDLCAEDARKAVALLDSPRIAAARTEYRKEAVKAARAQFELAADAWAGIMGIERPMRAAGIDNDQIVWHTSPRDWILPELDKRLATIQNVVAHAGLVPAYALAQPEAYDRLLDAMPNEPRYDSEVRQQITAHAQWMPEQDPFPSFM